MLDRAYGASGSFGPGAYSRHAVRRDGCAAPLPAAASPRFACANRRPPTPKGGRHCCQPPCRRTSHARGVAHAGFGGRIHPCRQGRRASPFGHQGPAPSQPRKAQSSRRPWRPADHRPGEPVRRSVDLRGECARIRQAGTSLFASSTSMSGQAPTSFDLRRATVSLQAASGSAPSAPSSASSRNPSPPSAASGRACRLSKEACRPSFDQGPHAAPRDAMPATVVPVPRLRFVRTHATCAARSSRSRWAVTRRIHHARGFPERHLRLRFWPSKSLIRFQFPVISSLSR